MKNLKRLNHNKNNLYLHMSMNDERSWAIVNGGMLPVISFIMIHFKIPIIDWHSLNEFILFISSYIRPVWYPLNEFI